VSNWTKRVLLVDSDEAVQKAVRPALQLLGYDVVAAASADEALGIIERQEIPCVVADVPSRALSSGDLIRRTLQIDPTIAVLVLTAQNDPECAMLCTQQGAVDYLLKPVAGPLLACAIQRALERRSGLIAQAEVQRLLNEEVSRLTVELRREQVRAERLSVAALGSLVFMMETQDRFLAGHSLRVAQMAAAMAAEMGKSEEEIESVRLAGRLHDIGMLCIGDGILSKQGSLTPEEFERVKQHVVIGSEILSRLPSLETVTAFVRGHHERYDGSGYPDGLTDERVPWGARLIGAAEIYDALTTARPYRETASPEEALKHMQDMAGNVLNPEAHEALVTLVRENRALIFIDGEQESAIGRIEIHTGMGGV
jgi:putative two-component system response regulator